MKQYKQLTPHAIRTRNPRHLWLEKNYPGFLHTIFMQGAHAGVWLQHQRYSPAIRQSYFFIRTMPSGQTELFHYWDLRDLALVREHFVRGSKRSLATFRKFYRQWERHADANLAAYAATESIEVRALTDKQLYALYQKLYWANMNQAAEGYMADCCLAAGTEDWLSQFISRHISDSTIRQEVIATLTAPTIPSYTNEEQVALQRIAQRIKGGWRTFTDFYSFLRRSPRLWGALVRHTKRYYWIENNYYAKVLTERYFAKKVYQLVRQPLVGDLTRELRKNQARKTKLLGQLNDAWLTNVVYFSEYMTHIQDYRKMCLIRFSHFLRLIFFEMGKRIGLHLDEMYCLVEPEVADVFLHHTFDRRVLVDRRRLTFVHSTKFGFVLYRGREVRRFVDERDFDPQDIAQDLIRGVSASPGVVHGVVRLVKNAHQPGRFNQGDILVTNNTTPEFVPLMRKAAAIITDQGGITTHAAIVSRELGIPCVIGTRVGTRVLRTGDRVEVDATKGVIRKL